MERSKGSASGTFTIIDATPPALVVYTLPDLTVTNNATLNVTGTVSDAGGVRSLTVNGTEVPVNGDGSFSCAVGLIEGNNTITVAATDNAGNPATDVRTITLDQTAPQITVTSPADNSMTNNASLSITGTVNENATVAVTLNGGASQAATMDGGNFTATVDLVAGTNLVEITATDVAGNISSAKRTVTYEPAGSLSLAVTDPAEDITTNESSILLKGTVSGALTAVTVTIDVDGQIFTPALVDGAFEQAITFDTAKSYAIVVTATDEATNNATVQRNVIYAP